MAQRAAGALQRSKIMLNREFIEQLPRWLCDIVISYRYDILAIYLIDSKAVCMESELIFTGTLDAWNASIWAETSISDVISMFSEQL